MGDRYDRHGRRSTDKKQKFRRENRSVRKPSNFIDFYFSSDFHSQTGKLISLSIYSLLKRVMNRGAYYDTNPNGSELAAKASPSAASGDVDSPPRDRKCRLLPMKQ